MLIGFAPRARGSVARVSVFRAAIAAITLCLICGRPPAAAAQSAIRPGALPICSEAIADVQASGDVHLDAEKVLPAPVNSDVRNSTGVRCDASGMAVAIRDNGNIRDIYTEKDGFRVPDDRLIVPTVRFPTLAEALENQKELYITPIIDRLKSRIEALTDAQPDVPAKILIYAHGGLVSHKDAVLSAEALAPMMMRDHYAPIFLIWNNDLPISYFDRLCCVRNGSSERLRSFNWAYFIPLHLIGDIGSSLARAPENFVQQVIRFKESDIDPDHDLYVLNYSESDGPGSACYYMTAPGGPHHCSNIHFPNFGGASPGEEDTLKGLLNGGSQRRLNDLTYLPLFPVRIATTAVLSQVGANAWDNMLRRTRLGFFAERRGLQAERRSCPEDAENGISRVDEPLYCPDGGFKRFFDALCENFKSRDGHITGEFNVGTAASPRWRKVTIEFYGHSMGAILGDELISRYGDLPFSKVVYMAAADTIRDFRNMTVAQTATRPEAFVFYNLSLHPLNESREREYFGVLPEGSLLEWIDEMFNGPKTADDRTLGKWKNLEATLPIWGRDYLRHVQVRVMPEQATLKNAKTERERSLFAKECDPAPAYASSTAPTLCHPLKHGDFNHFSFWRTMYQTGYEGAVTGAITADR